jgi:uncharacterized repeat protein (TIGR01451 family)
VSNLGPFDATGVRVSVQLPATAQGIAAHASGGVCSIAAAAAACTFGIARVGVSYTFGVTAISPMAGPFLLVASVAADQPDPHSSNNSVATTQSIANLADLAVTVSGSASAKVGDAVSFTAMVKNAGPNSAANTKLTYQLAAGLTLGTTSVTGATCANNASGLVTCNVGDLAAAKSATVTINATASVAGTQKSTAAASSMTTDLLTSNNTATSSTSVTSPAPPADSSSKGGGGALTINYLLMLGLILIMRRWAPKPR